MLCGEFLDANGRFDKSNNGDDNGSFIQSQIIPERDVVSVIQVTWNERLNLAEFQMEDGREMWQMETGTLENGMRVKIILKK